QSLDHQSPRRFSPLRSTDGITTGEVIRTSLSRLRSPETRVTLPREHAKDVTRNFNNPALALPSTGAPLTLTTRRPRRTGPYSVRPLLGMTLSFNSRSHSIQLYHTLSHKDCFTLPGLRHSEDIGVPLAGPLPVQAGFEVPV
ncbi:uncharacterized protein METZ01_LOCUS132309, partial [marine metagenome]